MRRTPIFPILLSVYPVLALASVNITEMNLPDAYRPLSYAMLGGVVIWGVGRLWLKDWSRSSVLTAVILFVFYSYGHVYNLVVGWQVGDLILGRHRYLAIVWVILAVVLIYLALKRIKDFEPVIEGLNWISILLVVFPLIQLISYQAQAAQAERNTQTNSGLETSAGSDLPDIYLIILDAYTRQDTLMDLYEYDNAEFITKLEEMGFYVADCSRSNYRETVLSVSTLLNFDFIQNFWDDQDYKSKAFFFQYIHHGRLRNFLAEQGYIMVAFKTGHPMTEVVDAELYLTPEGSDELKLSLINQLVAFNVLNPFEILLLDTTFATVLNDLEFTARSFETVEVGYEKRREQVLYTLDNLERMPNVDGPKFVFAHMITPHEPFVFDADGSPYYNDNGELTQYKEYAVGYTNQITHVNQRILPILQTIIEDSPNPPVIMIMGDHGPSDTEPEIRSTNLMAVYFPEHGDVLYPTISPINMTRLMLNTYFGADLPLVDDVYHHSWDGQVWQEWPQISNAPESCGS